MNTTTFLINGVSDATISPLDRGFAYGDGVFRTIRVKHGRATAWAEHYAKLVADSRRLSFACPDAGLWQEDIERLFADQADGVIKLMLTRGIGEEAMRLRIMPMLPVSPYVVHCRIIRSKTLMWVFRRIFARPDWHINPCLLASNTLIAWRMSWPGRNGLIHLSAKESCWIRMAW